MYKDIIVSGISLASRISDSMHKIYMLGVVISAVIIMFTAGWSVFVCWITMGVFLFSIQSSLDESKAMRYSLVQEKEFWAASWYLVECLCIAAVFCLSMGLGSYHAYTLLIKLLSSHWAHKIINTTMGLSALAPLAMIATFSLVSIDNVEKSKVPFLRNMLVIGLGIVMYQEIMEVVWTISSYLVIASFEQFVLLSLLPYLVYVLFIFVICIVLGWSPSLLINQNKRNFYQGLRYFMMGILLCFLLLSYVNPVVLWSAYVKVINVASVNIISWDVASYMLSQSLLILHVLVQTLYEELVFRSLAYHVMQACGFVKDLKVQDGSYRGSYVYIYDKVILILLLGGFFAGYHMNNPVENGRKWLSLIEKFLAYFSSGAAFASLQVLTGGIEVSWGWHFMHNLNIVLMRYDIDGIGGGFFQYNLYQSNISARGSIIEQALTTVVNMSAAFLAHRYLANTEDSKEEAAKQQLLFDYQLFN
jgi:hypothetical protein